MKKYNYHLIPIFLFVVSSLFSYLPRVKADAQTYSFDASWYSVFNEERFTACKTIFDQKISEGTYDSYFFDFSEFYSNGHNINVYAFSGLTSTDINNWSTAPEYSRFNLYFYGSSGAVWICSDRFPQATYRYGASIPFSFYLSFSDSTLKLYQFGYFNTSISNYFSFYNYPSRLPLTLNSSSGASFEFTQNEHLPTLYDMYLRESVPPTPTDEYPLLTSFYSTFIDRLEVLTTYIYSNYLILTIFAIFILYFTILLFRRLR